MANYRNKRQGPPTNGQYYVNDICQDVMGITWRCYDGGHPGKWLAYPVTAPYPWAITPNVGAIGITGVGRDSRLALNYALMNAPITETVGALALASIAPVISRGQGKVPLVGALALAGVASSLGLGMNGSTGSLGLTGNASVLS